MGTADNSIELAARAEKFVLDGRWAQAGDTIVLLFGSQLVPGVDHSVGLRKL